MKRTLLVLSFGALTAVASPSAHHSFSADYFEEQKVSLEGDVIAFELKNPHAWLHLAAVDENGERQKISAEWSNPARLKQAGFTVDSFKPGDHLIVSGSPGRDPAEHRIHLRTIHRPSDGWKWPKSGRDDDP
ncbi:MAG TPA: DUF6152 family protein [Vicinamibacterales bacterium]